jgi:hypothetical protein
MEHDVLQFGRPKAKKVCVSAFKGTVQRDGCG